MSNTTVAVRLAQWRVCFRMRNRPPDVRARLPFDPTDRHDVKVWIWGRMREREWSGDETVAYIVRWILWQAEKAGRGKCVPTISFSEDRPANTGQASKIPRLVDMPSSAGSSGLRRRGTFQDELREREAADELVACVATTIGEVCVTGSSHTERSAIAALSCVARVVHAVKSTLAETSVRHFVDELFLHPATRALSIPHHIRRRFRHAMVRLQATGSFRRDLSAVGWSCPGHQQWATFSRVLEAEFERRFS